MRSSLYIVAGLLLAIWGIMFWEFHSSGAVHILISTSLLMILNLTFNDALSDI